MPIKPKAEPSVANNLAPEQGLMIIDLAEDAVISIDEDQKIFLFNRGAEKIFGFTHDEMMGQPLDLLLPERLAAVHRNHVISFANSPERARRMGERREIFGRRKDGTEFPAEASISKAEVDGKRFFTVILRDISERKRAEQTLRVSLREKEILLKEIHHRVKNNLQVVSSLLGLQSRAIHDEQSRKHFYESQNRIQSMALIHERLYQSDSLSEIDSKDYVVQLTGDLFRSYGVSSSRVNLEIQVEQATLNLETAVPFGLILNELVSNALKYAFPDGRSGTIIIKVKRVSPEQFCLSVSDNGVGLPEDVNLWNAKSLGLRLVRILAAQLRATTEVHSENGVEIRLTYPAPKEPATA